LNPIRKLISGIALIPLAPIIITAITSLLGIEYLAPMITYFTCIVIFIYIYHNLIMSGLLFKLMPPMRGITSRMPTSPLSGYVMRSSILWMIFLPTSRILGDLVKWFITGTYEELIKGNYHLYLMLLMVIGFGAGAFFALSYISVIKREVQPSRSRRRNRR